MSGSVAVTRAIAAPGLLLLLDYRDGIKPAHWSKITPASVVLEALSGTCQSADCTIVLDARLPRTLPVYWQAVRLACWGVNANPHPKPTCRSGLLA